MGRSILCETRRYRMLGLFFGPHSHAGQNTLTSRLLCVGIRSFPTRYIPPSTWIQLTRLIPTGSTALIYLVVPLGPHPAAFKLAILSSFLLRRNGSIPGAVRNVTL